MEKLYRIDHTLRELTVAKNDGGYRITVAGKEYAATDASLENGILTFFVGRRSFRAAVSTSGNETRVTLDGRLFIVHGGEEEDTAARGTHQGDGSVEAPMPGNIVAVHVRAGDEVAAGDSILTLESMKMQNAVTASVAGMVAAVHCAVGDQVAFGELLAEIKPTG